MASAAGSGSNRVLLVGEALGEQEAAEGKPFVGRAGWQLNSMLQRLGLQREDFKIDNCLRCRPIGNKLSGEPFEAEALQHCKQYLKATVDEMRPGCIVALGSTTMNHLLPKPFDGGNLDERRGYVEWSAEYNCWVIPTYHPSHIMRGNQYLTGVWMNDLKHALEIAAKGHEISRTLTIEDPTPMEFLEWVLGYEAALAADADTLLSYDIETLGKQKATKEDDLDIGDSSYEILRIGFAYKLGEAISIPWSAEYIPAVCRLMASAGRKVAHNHNYDRPRLEAAGVKLNGLAMDTMWAWHVANSDLDKGLGFVATFYAWGQPRWKHLGAVNPARYNALDAAVTLEIAHGLFADLKELGLWDVYLRHVCELDQQLLWPMTKAGVLLDQDARVAASEQLQGQLKGLQDELQAAVPLEAKRLKVYKRLPKDGSDELIELPGERKTKACSRCGQIDCTKPHVSRKTIAASTLPLLEGVRGPAEGIKVVNPCLGASLEPIVVPAPFWGRPETFVPSNSQLSTYARLMKHRPVVNREGKLTFDDDALAKLCNRYATDPVYPIVQSYRNVEKILGAYVGYWDGERWDGGLQIGKDGRVHATYNHNPSTLRLASENPNVQVWPRGKTPEAKLVKRLVIAAPSCRLIDIDFSAIEAVLVGYFARSKDYIRLAKLGVHDYLNSHILHRAGRLAEPADVSWSDSDLRLYFADLKARFKAERDVAKMLVHGSAYGMTPNRMQQLHPKLFPTVKKANELQQLYFSVCPEVRQWQEHTVALADKQGYLRNPYGYLHRFWRVRNWTRERDGRWVATWGEDAKRALAFMPQSTAAGIIKEAMLRLQHTELLPFMRLQVHDSLLCEVPEERLQEMAVVLVEGMIQPCHQLPLPLEWQMGDYLSIGVEVKSGLDWGHMEAMK